jgi:hypothetical protein
MVVAVAPERRAMIRWILAYFLGNGIALALWLMAVPNRYHKGNRSH